MIKDCSTCIHARICSHKDKNEEYKKQMKILIEEWGVDNPFGYTEDCPEWHERYEVIHITSDMIPKEDKDMKTEPTSIKFQNESEINAIPYNGEAIIDMDKGIILRYNHEKHGYEDLLEEFRKIFGI